MPSNQTWFSSTIMRARPVYQSAYRFVPTMGPGVGVNYPDPALGLVSRHRDRPLTRPTEPTRSLLSSSRPTLLGTELAAAVGVQNRPCRAPERDGVADRGRDQSSSDTRLIPLGLTHSDMGI